MISYNSVDAIKTKVTYAHDNGYGGYMCWHMLSDYYENISFDTVFTDIEELGSVSNNIFEFFKDGSIVLPTIPR